MPSRESASSCRFAPPYKRRASDHLAAGMNSKPGKLAGGGFGGGLCRGVDCCVSGPGGNFQATFVHIESLFAIQSLNKLAGGLRDATGKAGGIDFESGLDFAFIAILIAELDFKGFHAVRLLCGDSEIGWCVACCMARANSRSLASRGMTTYLRCFLWLAGFLLECFPLQAFS